jgi:FecR-like protein
VFLRLKTLALVGFVVGAPGLALAQGQSGVGVVTTLVGGATVARAAVGQPQALKMRDDVFAQDRISTNERSVVHVLMGGKALLTVRELSVVTVTDDGGRATVNLQSGKVGLAVVRQRMKPGEVIEVHTPHAIAAVRGTVLVVEIVPGSAGGDQPAADGASTNVHLLHGKLDVSLRSNPAAAPIQLESLQTVTVSRDTLGTMRLLSPAAAALVTAGLKAHQSTRTALPEKFQAALGHRQRVLAVATAEGLSGNGQGRGTAKGQGGKSEAGLKGKANDAGSDRDSIGLVADTGDGAGSGDRNLFGAGIGGGSGNGGGNSWGNSGGGNGGGNSWGNSGGGNGGGSGNGRSSGPAFGPGTGTVGNGLATIVLPKLFKKK